MASGACVRSDWAAGEEPFPRLLRWALVAAPLAFAATFVLGWTVPYPQGDAVRIFAVLLYAVSGLCALAAVPTAACLLAFRPQYRNHANTVMTLIAAIPFAVAVFVIIIFLGMAITGGSLH